MFPQQKIILDTMPSLESLCSRYAWQTEPADWLQSAEEKARQFIIPVPLVGGFSCGKSSLVNALLGSPVFATSIDPETAVPAEVCYGEIESFTGRFPDGRSIALTREAVRENQLGILHPDGWVDAVLPAPELARLPHLRLVDMPGWGSGLKAHSTALDNYVARSLAYGVVVSTEEGNLRESIRLALKELAINDMPVFAVITKADKKPPEDVDQVLALVRDEITQTMGRPPFAQAKVSARKKDIAAFVSALQDLEAQAQPLFVKNVVIPLTHKLQSLHQHIDILLNGDDLNSEQIEQECAQIETDIAAFATRLNHETAQLDARVQPVLARIIERLQATLKGEIDVLSNRILNGGDWQGALGTTTRLAVERGMREEFTPEVQRYLDRVIDGLPEHFSPDVSYSFHLDGGKNNNNNTAAMLLTTIVPLLQAIPLGPIGKLIVGAVGALIGQLFGNSGHRETEEARQHEEIRQSLLKEVIPQVCQQVQNALQPQLHTHVQAAKDKIASNVRAQQASHEAALKQLQSQLEAGKTAIDQAQAQYRADQAYLQNLCQQLGAAA